MSEFGKIDAFLEEHLNQSLAELSHLCGVPSVAAQNQGIEECAEMVGDMLKRRGFKVEIIPTNGSPIVYAEQGGKSDKTLIFYNHYDVQPAEPLELWDSPPFEAALRDGKLFARGVSDDKGHISSRLHAIDAILAEDGELPCNLKWVIEGEEEVSSMHLPGFVKENAEKLAADACIWEFGGVDHRDVPIQMAGLRGICYVELSVEGTSTDVHSGLGGSIFPNAAWRLVWALGTLKGQDERIRIPGHYDNVVPASDRDMELFAAMPDPADDYKQRYGVDEFLGGVVGGAELNRQEVMEPTCTICGITTGYQGPGSKTVLPAKASAKVDFRLVPDMTPEEVLVNLRSHLDAEGFEDVQIEYLGGEAPGRTDPDDPFLQMVVAAAEDVYGVPQMVIPSSGGSGPNHAFLHYLDLPIATSGVGYPGNNVHAPNENIRVDLYLKGAQHITRILKGFAAG